MDIALTEAGDLFVGTNGDIMLVDSVAQKIRIRLLWFLGEWRWNDELGLPYMEDLLKKNPNIELMESAIREAIFDVDEVVKIKKLSIDYDRKTRECIISFVALTDLETIKEEVRLRA